MQKGAFHDFSKELSKLDKVIGFWWMRKLRENVLGGLVQRFWQLGKGNLEWHERSNFLVKMSMTRAILSSEVFLQVKADLNSLKCVMKCVQEVGWVVVSVYGTCL